MTILAFLVVTFGTGTAGLMTRRRPRLSIPIGFAGLVAAVVAAFLISPGDRLTVGASALVATDFMRLFVLFGSVAALALCAMALVEGWQLNLPSAMILGLGALALGLGLADPVAGLAATAAAGLPGVLVAITTPVDARGVRAAERELRAVAVTGALAIVAAALVSGPSGLLNLPVTIVGLAYLAMALAVAVRIGAIPFHTRVARVTGSAPVAALPLLLAWAPAGFASAALVWVDGNIATTAIPLESQRIVIVVVGLLCILLGIVAATIQDDIEHVVGYSVIQDAGFVMLALAIFDIAAWEPARAWLLIYIATKSAFAGWALAMRTSFGTSRIGELSGWVRRAPVLAIALLAIVAATVGVPGLLVFDVRSRLADLALGSPLGLLAVAGGFASLLYYGRLVKVGIGPVAPLVAAYPGITPRGPGWVRTHGWVPAGAGEMAAPGGGAIAAGATGEVGATGTADGVSGAHGSTGAGRGATARGRRFRRGPAADQIGFDDLAARPEGPDAAGKAAAPADGDGADRPAQAGDPADGVGAAAAGSDAGGAASAADGGGAAADAAGAAETGATATTATPPAGASRTAGAASSGRPESRGPSIDALRRDPKELTQAWAREALERAGLAPSTSGGTASGATDAGSTPRPPARSTGVHVIPPVLDPGAPSDPWTEAAAAASAPAEEAGAATPSGGAGDGGSGGREAGQAGAQGVSAEEPAAGAGPAWPESGGDAGGRARDGRRDQRARERRRPVARPDAGGAGTAVVGGRVGLRDLAVANRLLIVAMLALGLSAMGTAAAVGAFGVADAAKAAAPASGGGVEYGPIPAGPGAGAGPSGIEASPGPEGTLPGSTAGPETTGGTESAAPGDAGASPEATTGEAPAATDGVEATAAP